MRYKNTDLFCSFKKSLKTVVYVVELYVWLYVLKTEQFYVFSASDSLPCSTLKFVLGAGWNN